MGRIKTLFLCFMLYSALGWLYESTLYTITERRFVNRGFLNGPYCPIYGVGAVMNLFILSSLDNALFLFFGGALLDCTLEYVSSWRMEKLFHARWWDYSQRRFHLHGRICLLGAVVFGAFSVFLILLMHPLFSNLFSLLPGTAKEILLWSVLVLFLADSFYTLLGHSVQPSAPGIHL